MKNPSDNANKQLTSLQGWKYPRLAKSDSDGGYCYVIQRRISCYFSIFFNKYGLTPSQATLVDLVFGCLATLSIVFQYYLLSILFIWLFGIWSCVDGEIARLSNRCSTSGDFFDTMTDRVVEMSVIIALFWSIFTVDGQVNKYLALTFITYLGGVYLLAVSSEKYRSIVRGNYPKKEVEFFFSWISSGSDIRLLWLSVVIFTFWVMESQIIMMVQIGVLSVIFFINFTIRMFKVNNLLAIKTATRVITATTKLDAFNSGLKDQAMVKYKVPLNLTLSHRRNDIDHITTERKIQ
ncbi:MAG: CDP-alcohol phosphatidyltransferase family protein [Calditrichia bacterium]